MLKIEQILRNEDGKNVLNDSFDSILIQGNFIIVVKNGLTGLYDLATFSQIFKCEWDQLKLEGKYIIAYKNNMHAIFDLNGNTILDLNWDKVVLLKNGILVQKDGKEGFYDYNGNIILECKWKRIEWHHQVLIAYKGNGSRGILFDFSGNEIKKKKQ